MQPVQQWLDRLSVGPSTDGSGAQTRISTGDGTMPIIRHDAAVLAACDMANKAAAAELLVDMMQLPAAPRPTTDMAAPALKAANPLYASQQTPQTPQAVVEPQPAQLQAGASPSHWLADEIASRMALQVGASMHSHHWHTEQRFPLQCVTVQVCDPRCIAGRRCTMPASARTLNRNWHRLPSSALLAAVYRPAHQSPTCSLMLSEINIV